MILARFRWYRFDATRTYFVFDFHFASVLRYNTDAANHKMNGEADSIATAMKEFFRAYSLWCAYVQKPTETDVSEDCEMHEHIRSILSQNR